MRSEGVVVDGASVEVDEVFQVVAAEASVGAAATIVHRCQVSIGLHPVRLTVQVPGRSTVQVQVRLTAQVAVRLIAPEAFPLIALVAQVRFSEPRDLVP